MSNEFVRGMKDSSETQENLNPQQNVFPIVVRTNENLLMEETYTVIKSNDTSDMAIWDNPNTTWDGVDTNDQWDSYADNSVIIRITNPNNAYIERFAFDTLEGANTTATWDTTNREVTFTAGQVLEIVSAFKDSSSTQTVLSATLGVTIDSGSFDLEMSANGGTNWESVTNNSTHTFTNTGSDLRIRITENAASTGTINKIVCAYSLG